MRVRSARRGGFLGLIAAASLVAAAMPASAAAGDGTAYGVTADIELPGQPAVTVPPTPVADADGDREVSADSVLVPGLLETGLIDTLAVFDPDTGIVGSSATVHDLRLTGLLPGSIAMAYAECTAIESDIRLWVQLYYADIGVIGEISEFPEPNTVIEFGWADLPPGTPDLGPSTEPLVRLTLNEQLDNPDGSRTVNAVHIELLAAPLGTGHVVLASATCGPAAVPVPLAAGAGLWLSVGLLGLAIVPAAIALRRRQVTDAVSRAQP